jgi:hypothetical protein
MSIEKMGWHTSINEPLEHKSIVMCYSHGGGVGQSFCRCFAACDNNVRGFAS